MYFGKWTQQKELKITFKNRVKKKTIEQWTTQLRTIKFDTNFRTLIVPVPMKSALSVIAGLVGLWPFVYDALPSLTCTLSPQADIAWNCPTKRNHFLFYISKNYLVSHRSESETFAPVFKHTHTHTVKSVRAHKTVKELPMSLAEPWKRRMQLHTLHLAQSFKFQTFKFQGFKIIRVGHETCNFVGPAWRVITWCLWQCPCIVPEEMSCTMR